MSQESKVYSFLDTLCAFVGPTGSFSLTGSVAAEGISVTMNMDNATTVWGAGGEWVHSLIAQKGAELSVKLLKNSGVNQLLSAAYNLQKTSSVLSGQNVITINSTLGDSLVLSGVIFKKLPMVQFGQEAQILEWTFTCGRAEMLLGVGI
jgi:hypothetical protein